MVFTSAEAGPNVPSLALLPVSIRRELLLNVATGKDEMKLAKPHQERERGGTKGGITELLWALD